MNQSRVKLGQTQNSIKKIFRECEAISDYLISGIICAILILVAFLVIKSKIPSQKSINENSLLEYSLNEKELEFDFAKIKAYKIEIENLDTQFYDQSNCSLIESLLNGLSNLDKGTENLKKNFQFSKDQKKDLEIMFKGLYDLKMKLLDAKIELLEKTQKTKDIDHHINILAENQNQKIQKDIRLDYKIKLSQDLNLLYNEKQKLLHDINNLEKSNNERDIQKTDDQKNQIYSKSIQLENEKDEIIKNIFNFEKDLDFLNKQIPKSQLLLEKYKLQLQDLKLEHQILLLMNDIEDKELKNYQEKILSKISELNRLVKSAELKQQESDFQQTQQEILNTKKLISLKKKSEQIILQKDEEISQLIQQLDKKIQKQKDCEERLKQLYIIKEDNNKEIIKNSEEIRNLETKDYKKIKSEKKYKRDNESLQIHLKEIENSIKNHKNSLEQLNKQQENQNQIKDSTQIQSDDLTNSLRQLYVNKEEDLEILIKKINSLIKDSKFLLEQLQKLDSLFKQDSTYLSQQEEQQNQLFQKLKDDLKEMNIYSQQILKESQIGNKENNNQKQIIEKKEEKQKDKHISEEKINEEL